MDKIRLGVIGAGVMGPSHGRSARRSENYQVTAVCDIRPDAADRAAAFFEVPAFYDHKSMFASGLVDAVIISTPHYAHTPIAMDAFASGIHVMSDKPMAVHKKDALKMIEAHRASNGLQFGVMFQLRTSAANKKLHDLLHSGELGRIRRINWIITTWLRTQKYYDSGDWRASWRGEGGGALLNQCPHQLDLFQWFFGMPNMVRAYCKFGKYHDIEVEDEVTSYMEFADGVTAVFITSTAEVPGTNRLEVTCDRGRLVLESGVLTFQRTEELIPEIIAHSSEKMPSPATWSINIPLTNDISATEVFDHFADAIRGNGKPLVTGEEAINSLELANAMLLSTFLNREITLPLDADLYETELMKRVAQSRYCCRAGDREE